MRLGSFETGRSCTAQVSECVPHGPMPGELHLSLRRPRLRLRAALSAAYAERLPPDPVTQ